MKKTILFTLMAFAVGMGAVACKDNNEVSSSTSSSDNQQASITFSSTSTTTTSSSTSTTTTEKEVYKTFDFGTTQSNGYNESRVVTFEEIDIELVYSQVTTSTNDPHTNAGAFLVLSPTKNPSDENMISSATFDFKSEVIKEVSFDATFWSANDEKYNLGLLEKVELQHFVNDTWETVKEFKADVTAANYTTLTASVNSSKIRFIATGNGRDGTYQIRTCIDNVVVYK